MKTIIKNTLLLVLLISLSSFINTSLSHQGKWKGEDKGDIGLLTLTQDNYAIFEFDGIEMGGKSYEYQGTNSSMSYSVTKGVEYNSIDFIITDLDNKEELGRMLGIFKMESNDKMRLAMGFGGKGRPENFEIDSVIFNRAE
jgi:hypothetical protein